MIEFLIQAIVFLPLLTAVLVGLNTESLKTGTAQIITVSGVVLSAIFSWIVFIDVYKGNTYAPELFKWVESGNFSVLWVIKVDMLTAIMLTLVTTVSSLVHIYSVGYMSHDDHPQRFFSYLSLFTFFMLMLVTSDNLLQLFLGWEGVGLCSYLLIGFWYKKPSANSAAMKAFIVNRVGDFGMALGLFAIFHIFGTIDFAEIFSQIPDKRMEIITILGTEFRAFDLICVLLFVGCMGKSAQLGLHTWLPDAMEGPTPVSALIHAATMVTAGIFLVARMSPLFEQSQIALNMITVIGASTALFAATIALTQNDIKKIIAYSTCSQLGYMFFACGVSAYGAGIFHLYTHGFFKALLFLSAGSVIHAMSDEQDIRRMGALWKKIPLTYLMMLIGTLAITGFPLLSGYYSKDMVLETAFAAGQAGNKYGEFAFWMGISAATLTAFYSWRLMFLVFHGKSRADQETIDHIHESPKVMTIPLIILALGAIFIGGVFANKLGIVHGEIKFWHGAVALGKVSDDTTIYEAAHHVPKWVKQAPLAVGGAGFVFAALCYLLFRRLPSKIASFFRPLYLLFYNKWYFDEIYDLIIVNPLKKLAKFLWKFFDTKIIDGLGPNGFAFVSSKVGAGFRVLQSGYIYHYSFVMLIGLILILGYFIF